MGGCKSTLRLGDGDEDRDGERQRDGDRNAAAPSVPHSPAPHRAAPRRARCPRAAAPGGAERGGAGRGVRPGLRGGGGSGRKPELPRVSHPLPANPEVPSAGGALRDARLRQMGGVQEEEPTGCPICGSMVINET